MLRVLKRILRQFLVLVLVVLAFAGGAVAVLTLTERGRDNLAGIVSNLASTPGQGVAVSGISGIWSNPTRVEQVVLSDAKGPWIVLRGVEVEWSLWPLLDGTFSADRVAARRIELARLPEADPAKPPSDAPTTLPIGLRIGAIDLPDIALGTDIAGAQVASISATGRLTALPSPLDVTADLRVERRDGIAGDLDATVRFAPAQQLLDLDVRAGEPQGGILANLLRLPGAPAVQLIASGSGALADWKGQASFAVDGKVVTTVSGTHRETPAGRAIALTGEGDFAPFVPERLANLVEGATQLDFAGVLGPDGELAIERADARSAALALSAKGALDPAGASDISATVTAAGAGVPFTFGDPAAPVRLVVASADLRVQGEGRQPALTVTARLPSVEAAGLSVLDISATVSSDAFDTQSLEGPFSLTAKAGLVAAEQEQLRQLLDGAVTISATGALGTDTVTIAAAELSTGSTRAKASGTVSRRDGSLDLVLDATVPAALVPEAARKAIGDQVAVAGRVRRSASGAISLNDAAVRSGGLALGGSFALDNGQVDADFTGALEDVAVLSPQARGAATFSVALDGALVTPDFALQLAGPNIVVAGRQIDNLAVEARGKADPAAPAAALTIGGSVSGEALSGQATLASANGASRVDDLTLTLGRNSIKGSLDLDAAFAPEGSISFELPELGPLAALALEAVEGDLAGSVTLSRSDGAVNATVDARATRLVRNGASVGGLSVKASIDDLLRTPLISGNATADRFASGGTTLTGVKAQFSREGSGTRFDVAANMDGAPLAVAGTITPDGAATVIALDRARATWRGIAAALSAPTTVRIVDGGAQLDGLAVALGAGSATVSGRAGATLDLRIALARLPASLANTFAPGLAAQGSISGTVTVKGAAADPDVDFDVTWTGASTSQTTAADIGTLGVTAKGRLSGGTLRLDAVASGGDGLRLTAGGTVGTRGAPTLGITVNGSIPFSLLSRRLAAQGLALSGTATLNATVRGAAAQPSIDGRVTTSGARFVDARSGVAVNGIAAEIVLGGRSATVSRLSGTLASGGTVSGSGTIGFDSGLPADLTIRLADARYSDGQSVATTFSGDIAVRGPLASAPVLSGRIALARTVITVPERLPGGVADLDVKHRNASAAVVAQDRAIRPNEQSGGGSGLMLDLTIDAPQQIFVQGRGLDAELGGSLKLTGPLAAPQAVGQFTLRRGRLAVLGRRLTFTAGSLGFSGSLVPYIDFTAESSANDATVTVQVTGPANNPKFAFSSIPSLPEDEVLARLVFGRSLTNLSPVQIAQLAEAAAQFAGVGGSTSLLNSLRSQLGVDDLDVKTDAQGNTAVSAGKYLNERTYITIEKGDRAGSGRAKIDLDIGRGVKLRGEASDGGEAKGGIFYEREY